MDRNFLEEAGKGVTHVATDFKKLNVKSSNTIRIVKTGSDFEREPLIHPFGFKGAYLTELWQTVCRLESANGFRKIGIGTQSVLYADAEVFASHSEAAGNALMYILTEKSLQLAGNFSFVSPTDLIEEIFPYVYEEGRKLTGRKNLNKMFALNALVAIDNAAWLLYCAENKFDRFDAMIPDTYKIAFSCHSKKLAVMYMVSYGSALDELEKAVKQGYFIIKIKIGQVGSQEEMLQKDMDRLTEIHNRLKNIRTEQTPGGKLTYTMDANGRYEKKETLLKLLDHAKKIGAFDQILLIEEPFHETNETPVGDIGIRIAADESAYDEASTIRRLEQGYGALVLKGIAKTLSLTLKMANLAHERGVPCLCADLTANPILADWHKNLASHIAPFPEIDMGILEINGDLNYRNWQSMLSYNPSGKASWAQPRNGVFELDEDFYMQSGGIWQTSEHYRKMFEN
jgi:hypothetical protein